jgi:hypothetical protein
LNVCELGSADDESAGILGVSQCLC